MKCIVCDRCKKIVEDPRRCRVITCARPLKFTNNKVPYTGNDKQMNDIIWEKELCSDCLDELEQFLDSPAEAEPETGGSGEPTEGGEGSV